MGSSHSSKKARESSTSAMALFEVWTPTDALQTRQRVGQTQERQRPRNIVSPIFSRSSQPPLYRQSKREEEASRYAPCQEESQSTLGAAHRAIVPDPRRGRIAPCWCPWSCGPIT